MRRSELWLGTVAAGVALASAAVAQTPEMARGAAVFDDFTLTPPPTRTPAGHGTTPLFCEFAATVNV